MAPFLLLIVWAADVAPCTLLDAKGTPLMDASGWLSLLTQDVLGMHVFYLSSQSGLTSSMPVFYRERLYSWTSASWKVATHFPVMRPSSGLDPNFRNPGHTFETSISYREVSWGTRTQWKKVSFTCTVQLWWCIHGPGSLWPH
jgi:hypothetical protein